MINSLKQWLKNNRLAYAIYYYLGSLFINLLKLFVKADDKTILFVSYGGRRYSDSPRVLYEAMLCDARFAEFAPVWAFINPDKYTLADGTKKIRIDSLSYYITALKARCWITNVIIERALNFTGKNTFYFHTTHGTLVKLGGKDVKGNIFDTLSDYHYDCSLAQSEYERQVEMKCFGLPKEKIEIFGYPKNDILVTHTEQYRNVIRKKLGISDEKICILYAPTFREDTDLKEQFNLDVALWQRVLGDEFVLLYRAHPVVKEDEEKGVDTRFFLDVTSYDPVEDLMIASDVLISDYSGLIFDYCIMGKPIFLWTYDYEEYAKKRGFYFDMRKELPYEEEEEALLNRVSMRSERENSMACVNAFRDKYATEYGSATKKCLDLIYQKIGRQSA